MKRRNERKLGELEKARIEVGASRAELAEEMGLSWQGLYAIERRDRLTPERVRRSTRKHWAASVELIRQRHRGAMALRGVVLSAVADALVAGCIE